MIGNEWADTAAGAAATNDTSSQDHQQAITYKSAKALIGREVVDPQTTHERTKAVFDGPRDQEPLSRCDAVLMAQLRSRHCRKLAAYRNIIESNFSSICPHCEAEAETLEQWLQECPATAAKRTRVFGGGGTPTVSLGNFTQGCPSVRTRALVHVNACRQQQQQQQRRIMEGNETLQCRCKYYYLLSTYLVP